MNIHEAYACSDPQTPIVILTCKHVHSATIIQDVARTKVIKCQTISLGNSGQRNFAEKMMLSGPGLGIWLLLENGQLDLSYLAGIPGIMEKINGWDEHFRLFITAEFIENFPTNLLAISLRQYAEPALGLKANLIASLSWIEPDILEAVASSEWVTLVYAMSFLHAWTVARKAFSKRGWCRQYEFHRNDLLHCFTFMKVIIEANEERSHGMSRPEIPWQTVQQMYTHVVLGSAIDHKEDQAVLETQIKRYITSRVYSSDFSYGLDFPGPFGQDLQSFVKSLSTHAANESADVFGLDSAVRMETDSSQSDHMRSYLLTALSKSRASDDTEMSSVRSQEQIVLDIATKMLDEIPSQLDLDISTDTRLQGRQGSRAMQVFCASERQQLHFVLRTVRMELDDLMVHLRYGLQLGTERRQLASAILRAGTPANWMSRSFHIPYLPKWIEQVRGAHGQIEMIMTSELKGPIGIGYCFNPAALTRYHLSQMCSTNNWPAESAQVTLMISNTDLEGEKVNNDLQVSGLWLQGAGWDARASKLVASPNSAKAFVALPPARLVVEQRSPEAGGLMAFKAPLYTSTSARSSAAIVDVLLMTVFVCCCDAPVIDALLQLTWHRAPL